jgi:predicted metal-dependent phosphoesterase TrpH
MALVDSFCRTLLGLLSRLEEAHRDDATVISVKIKVRRAIGLAPVEVVKKVGPRLAQYRGLIERLNVPECLAAAEAELLALTFQREIETEDDPELAGYAARIIPMVRAAYLAADEDGRQYLRDAALDLLVDYLKSVKTRALGCD